MQLTVIGFWGGYPSIDEASSAYLLEKSNFKLMLDFGSGVLAKLPKFTTVTEIDAVLLSHYHADHIADVGVLQHAILVENLLAKKEKTIKIYGHNENVAEFERLNHDFTEGVRYDPGEVLIIGPFFIRFLKTEHSVPCYGMRITDGSSTIVYTADSAYQNEWIRFAKDADLLLADTNFYAGQSAADAGHMTSTEVASIAKQANVSELILTHLPHFGKHHQLVREAATVYAGNITLAREGLVWKKQK